MTITSAMPRAYPLYKQKISILQANGLKVHMHRSISEFTVVRKFGFVRDMKKHY